MGVATQNAELRRHFIGHYEYLVNYFTFLAREVREYLAEMGFRRLSDIVGHTELIEVAQTEGKLPADTQLDFSRLLYRDSESAEPLHFTPSTNTKLPDNLLDKRLVGDAAAAISSGEEVSLDYAIRNTDRAVGAMLSGEIASRYGLAGLPQSTINVKFKKTQLLAGDRLGIEHNKKTGLMTIHMPATSYAIVKLQGARL